MAKNRVDVLLKKAWTLLAANRVDLAIEQGEKAVALKPTCDVIELEVGVLAFKALRFDKAYERFAQATVKNPANLTAYVNGAKALLKLERAAEALAFAKRGLANDSAHLGSVLAAGMAELALDRPDDALARFRSATKIDPRSGDAWRQVAVVLSRLERLDEAMLAIRESCAVQPNSASALWERGRILSRLDQKEDAWDAYLQVMKMRGEKAEQDLLLELAQLAYELRKFGDAVKVSEKALSRDKDCAKGWLIKGYALEAANQKVRGAVCRGTGRMIQGQLERALAEFDDAVASDPKSAAGWCNRGVCLERMGRLDDALKNYDQAIEFDRGQPILWHNRGVLLMGPLDRRADALASFRREIKIDHRRWFDLSADIRKALGSP